MNGYDPYAAPRANLDGAGSHGTTGLVLTEQMILSLSQSRPWVKFLAILGFISAALMLIGALIMMIMGMTGSTAGGGDLLHERWAAVALGFAYIIGAALYVVPCRALYRYGAAIENVTREMDPTAFEAAVMFQRDFWKICGIFVVVGFVLYLIVFAAIMVFAFFSAL